MARHRSHRNKFKRQVVRECLVGRLCSLNSFANRQLRSWTVDVSSWHDSAG